MAFIERNRDEPFFLWLSFNAPHTPLQAREVYYERFAHIGDPIKRIYAAMIANLDDAIGAVLDHLEGMDLEKKTLIFFISDNGGAEYTFTTENGPYKGGKVTDFEGGIRVPFIMKWKDRIPEGKTYEPMVSSLDIFHTVVGAARLTLPDDRVYDGVDLLPHINGGTASDPHDVLFWQRGFSKALRTDRWKLFLNEDAGDTLLYDLAGDPLEQANVAGLYQDVTEELLKRHSEWSAGLANPLWPSLVYYVYEDGNLRHYFDQ
jgi:arylsulfatase A-like enzyme